MNGKGEGKEWIKTVNGKGEGKGLRKMKERENEKGEGRGWGKRIIEANYNGK